MFAINHAAAALPLKRCYPEVPLPLLLLSVQAIEILWVVLNLIGVESTRTEASVHYVGDIHLSHMPWSHSVGGALLVAGLLAGAFAIAGRRKFALAMGLGVLSHLVLDLLTHAPDIALFPPWLNAKIGTGLYTQWPLVAFFVEFAFALWCWRTYRGSRGLLILLVAFNLTNLTLFLPNVTGPEALLSGRPLVLAALIGVQIAVTLTLVGLLAREGSAATSSTGTAS